ncbi:unnamed protein product [Ectocarpus sp. 6 AP-2014]
MSDSLAQCAFVLTWFTTSDLEPTGANASASASRTGSLLLWCHVPGPRLVLGRKVVCARMGRVVRARLLATSGAGSSCPKPPSPGIRGFWNSFPYMRRNRPVAVAAAGGRLCLLHHLFLPPFIYAGHALAPCSLTKV